MFEGLTEKTILITGVGGGIGSETARVCAGNGANLVLTDISDAAFCMNAGSHR